MDSLFGAVLTQLPDLEKNLLISWLQVNGSVVKECTYKNWKDFPDSIRLFSKPSPELTKELLDWSIEPILCGKFSQEEKVYYQSAGVSLLWDKPFSQINSFPIHKLPEKKLTWIVCTKNPNFDQNISTFLKSLGYQVFIEVNPEYLIKRLLVGPCHFLILDWDNLDAKTLVPSLQKIKREKPFLSLGIKDFDKEHLYRDLKMGISVISEVLVGMKEFWNIFLESFPLSEEFAEIKQWKESSYAITKLSFSFQEKRIPVSMKQTETTILKANPIQEDHVHRIDLFRWLSSVSN
ncbi:hypothetical protein LEP1GSC202_2320 [Leptospira yanagawae serovar Saopaulo str. Sao Paulo = ATCC 700523]|uniref:Uncharacterized protein n=1 Tax=Leptospira yanagawae serovar Saopaulo str. Sao Paulo = ATCC 700523 TaxID=1249483 RepID=A0A5E8HEM0_9LEPT|nr:hypothetical protein [Leptospira yanagawae]EOQ88436.1 hypothetical protein LEP1GSC202_2320 [Leptospira yanagawae serovar Saopaulo str. Sao Paulo = ATCC 700523]